MKLGGLSHPTGRFLHLFKEKQDSKTQHETIQLAKVEIFCSAELTAIFLSYVVCLLSVLLIHHVNPVNPFSEILALYSKNQHLLPCNWRFFSLQHL